MLPHYLFVGLHLFERGILGIDIILIPRWIGLDSIKIGYDNFDKRFTNIIVKAGRPYPQSKFNMPKIMAVG